MLVPFHHNTKMTPSDPCLIKWWAASETGIFRLQTRALVFLSRQWPWGEGRNEARSVAPDFWNHHAHPHLIFFFLKRALINNLFPNYSRQLSQLCGAGLTTWPPGALAPLSAWWPLPISARDGSPAFRNTARSQGPQSATEVPEYQIKNHKWLVIIRERGSPSLQHQHQPCSYCAGHWTWGFTRVNGSFAAIVTIS